MRVMRGLALTTTALTASLAFWPAHGAGTRGQLEEITVTAQKRSERLQRVPLAVTSLDSRGLRRAQITNAQDLTRVIPNLQVNSGGAAGDSGGGNAQISIRGLGSSPTGPQGSAGVALHLDGIFLQQGLSNNQFFDIARIEVSPGPQGTLYGRSAAAGAVNIITNKPTQTPEASLSLEAGNYGLFRSTGMVNYPLSDTFAVRGAFQTANHDGYFSNGYDDLDSAAGRLHAQWRPSERLSVLVSADYLHNGGLGSSPIFVGPAALGLHLPADPWDRSLAGYSYDQGRPTPVSPSIDFRKWSVSSEIKYDFGPATLTLKPGFIRTTDNNLLNPIASPYSTYSTTGVQDNETTLEVRLSDSGNSRLRWVGGFNFFDNTDKVNVLEDIAPDVLNTVPFTPQRIYAFDNTQSSEQQTLAVFGQATYPVFDWLRATVGGRYNYDHATYRGQLGTTGVFLNGLPPNVNVLPLLHEQTITPELQAASSWYNASYKFTLDADVAPHSLAYATVGTGTKPGGLNDGGPPSSNLPGSLGARYPTPQVFQPEKNLHFEIGSKNRFLDGTLQVNDALFYDNYRNYQNGNTQAVNPVAIGALGFIVTNAGNAHIYGNEFSLNWLPTPNDLFSASVNYLQATFVSYTVAGHVGSSASVFVPTTSYAGYRLPNAPAWSGSFAYQHVFDLHESGRVTAAASMFLSSSYSSFYQQTPGTRQNGFTKTTLTLGYDSPGGRWSVQAYVKNLEDRATYTFGGTTSPWAFVFLDDPRTFGAVVTVHLGGAKG